MVFIETLNMRMTNLNDYLADKSSERGVVSNIVKLDGSIKKVEHNNY